MQIHECFFFFFLIFEYFTISIFKRISFQIKILPENSKNLTYKDKSFPIDYVLLKRNSEFFQINNNKYKYKENIPLLEEEGNSDFPLYSIQEFVRCCQNQQIEINPSNIFYLKYLAKKYKVQSLEETTNDIISSNKGQLALESLLFTLSYNSTLHFVETADEENIISSNFDQFMKDERLFQVPIPILYRIVQKYYLDFYNTNNSNEQSVNNASTNDLKDEFSAFLFKLLDKNPKKASMFFEFFDIQNSRLKDFTIAILMFSIRGFSMHLFLTPLLN
ncbi:hypothetical protein M9Y10_019074 [Tritrichomonas musculus]|uniref:Uncharacterized protein n=1 Tax=Tritrichomonas musculus TaxID=1915356 RepID=A0ABR2HIG7_9EUKA